MFNNPELDAIVEKYYGKDARPSISSVMYLRDQEKKEALQQVKDEGERVKREFDEKERVEHLKTIKERKEAQPYSEPLAIEICERISSGELLINICADGHMPTVRRVTQWLRENQDFAALYRESMNDRLTIFEEEVIKIADDAARDFRDVVRNGRTVRALDGDAIARAKLRVEVRFRHLKAGNPAKWGETSTLITKDANDLSELSAEELEKKLADLETKDRAVKAA
jgi:hypothetical protein